MSYLERAKKKLLENFDIICNCLRFFNVDIEKTRIYGYFLDNSTGATADLNLLVQLTLIDKYEIYDWEDIKKQKLENELTEILKVKVIVNTTSTLEKSLVHYPKSSELITTINKIAMPMLEFSEQCKN